MIAAWMLRAVIAAALVGVAARLLDEVVRWSCRPRRWSWAAALALSAALATVSFRPGLLPIASPGLLPIEGWVARIAAAGAAPALPASVAQAVADGGVRHAPAPGVWRLWSWSGTVDGVLALLWTGASIVLLLALSRAHLRMRAARDAGSEAWIDGVRVIVTPSLGPAAIGVLRPAVVVPRWAVRVPPEERALILRHEREHVRAGDARLLAAATLPLVLLPWCFPLWWLHRRLRDAIETDCDARVLARGADPEVYGGALLRTAGRPSATRFPAPAFGRKHTRLERRLDAMTTARPKHLALRALPLAAAAIVAFLAACDASLSPLTDAPDQPTTDEAATGLKQVAATWEDATIIVDGEQIAGGVDAIDRLDPADIESVEVIRPESTIRIRTTTDAQAAAEPVEEAARLGSSPGGEDASDADPLVLIDGERVEGGLSAARDLDPADIARIEVIKGATAVALYGGEGADGVIQITMK